MPTLARRALFRGEERPYQRRHFQSMSCDGPGELVALPNRCPRVMICSLNYCERKGKLKMSTGFTPRVVCAAGLMPFPFNDTSQDSKQVRPLVQRRWQTSNSQHPHEASCSVSQHILAKRAARRAGLMSRFHVSKLPCLVQIIAVMAGAPQAVRDCLTLSFVL